MAKLLPSQECFSLIFVISTLANYAQYTMLPNIQMVQTNHVNRAYHHSKMQCSHTVCRFEINSCTAVSEKGDDEVHPIISMVFDKNMQRGIAILVPLVRIDAWLQQNLTKMLQHKKSIVDSERVEGRKILGSTPRAKNIIFRSLQVHCNHAQAYM